MLNCPIYGFFLKKAGAQEALEGIQEGRLKKSLSWTRWNIR